jgi:hypothetical protein
MSNLTWQVYDPSGDRIAACASPIDAARVVGARGNGAKVKRLGLVVWTQGRNGWAGDRLVDAAWLMEQAYAERVRLRFERRDRARARAVRVGT